MTFTKHYKLQEGNLTNKEFKEHADIILSQYKFWVTAKDVVDELRELYNKDIKLHRASYLLKTNPLLENRRVLKVNNSYVLEFKLKRNVI